MKKPWRYHGECCASGGPAAKTLGACGPSGFGLGTSLGTIFTMIPPGLFKIMSQYTLYTLHFTLYTVHCTLSLSTVHCTLSTVHCTLYTVLPLYTVGYSGHCPLYTVHPLRPTHTWILGQIDHSNSTKKQALWSLKVPDIFTDGWA